MCMITLRYTRIRQDYLILIIWLNVKLSLRMERWLEKCNLISSATKPTQIAYSVHRSWWKWIRSLQRNQISIILFAYTYIRALYDITTNSIHTVLDVQCIEGGKNQSARRRKEKLENFMLYVNGIYYLHHDNIIYLVFSLLPMSR